MGIERVRDRLVRFDDSFYVGLACNRLLECQVARPIQLEERLALKAEPAEVAALRRNLSLRNTTNEVGLYVFRFRVWGVVHIAPDVQVVIVLPPRSLICLRVGYISEFYVCG